MYTVTLNQASSRTQKNLHMEEALVQVGSLPKDNIRCRWKPTLLSNRQTCRQVDLAQVSPETQVVQFGASKRFTPWKPSRPQSQVTNSSNSKTYNAGCFHWHVGPDVENMKLLELTCRVDLEASRPRSMRVGTFPTSRLVSFGRPLMVLRAAAVLRTFKSFTCRGEERAQ